MAPSIAASLIVYKGGKKLRRCLQSLEKHVDEIVVLDTGPKPNNQDEKIVLSFGGKYFHDASFRCAHGYDFIDDFAGARNLCMSKVVSDYMLWIDSDDLLVDGEALRPLVAEIDQDKMKGCWLEYHYAHDEYGNCTTLFDRERIIKLADGWWWQGRLHETLASKNSRSWIRSNDVHIVHTSGYQSRAERNFHLLNLMLQEEPDNCRIWVYMAHQHFAGRDWEEAAQWYAKFYNDPRGISEERWNAKIYACKALRELGRYRDSIRVGFSALEHMPTLQDSYIEIGESYARLGEWDKAIFWLEQARGKPLPTRLVFLNPLDYTFRIPSVLNIAYAATGALDKAIETCQEALQVRPQQEEIVGNLVAYKEAMEKDAKAQNFYQLTRGMDDDSLLHLGDRLDGIRDYKLVKEITIPAQLRIAARGTQPRMHIYCGQSIRPWTPQTPEAEGIGGSETACIEISSRLSNDGWNVVVYGTPASAEGFYNGVGYVKHERFRAEEHCDILVGFRVPDLGAELCKAKAKWLWAHDLNYGDRLNEESASGFGRILGVSEWHSQYLKALYPFAENVDFVHNGVDVDRFTQWGSLQKQSFKCVYASSPDRGLLGLLAIWPEIVRIEPEAELHIFYGFDNIDRLQGPDGIWGQELKAVVMERIDQPGVFYRGNVPQDVLAKEFCSAQVWLYPTSFLEVFCITAVEAMCAGLIPVTSQLGALPEVLGDVGWQIPGHAGSFAYRKAWTDAALASLMDLETKVSIHKKALARGPQWSWDASYQKWSKLVAEVVNEDPVRRQRVYSLPA
ncbi:MAG: glycosyltransferase [Candidatus Brocadiales bacterium]